MKTYIYLLLTKGSDGKFTTRACNTLEDAQKVLEMYIDAQKELEGFGDNIYIDRHELERLRLPEFIMRDDDILAHVTVNVGANYDGEFRVCKTERYIIRVEMN